MLTSAFAEQRYYHRCSTVKDVQETFHQAKTWLMRKRLSDMPTQDLKPTQDLNYTRPYPNTVDRATFAVDSTCGAIQLTHQIGHDTPPRRVFFRPDSPVYNIQNTAAGGHEIVPLRDASTEKPDVVAVTFTNTTRSAGTVTIRVSLNYLMAERQEILYHKSPLQPGSSVTIHVVLNRHGITTKTLNNQEEA